MSEPGQYPAGDPGQQLVSQAEREAAIAALQTHRASGRLSSAEYEDRQVLAGSVRRWEELTRLFGDLPQPHPVQGGVVAVPPSSLPASAQPVSGPVEAVNAVEDGLIPVPPQLARGILALSPFVALVLFFTTPGGWLWFLMIPVLGILFGGSAGKKDRKRDR
jgi:hypothetical protein